MITPDNLDPNHGNIQYRHTSICSKQKYYFVFISKELFEQSILNIIKS